MLIGYSVTAFSQTQAKGGNTGSEPTKTARTFLDLMVNVVSTSLNYGGDNSGLADYKKTNNGIQAGASFQAGITPGFSLVTELYYIRKEALLAVAALPVLVGLGGDDYADPAVFDGAFRSATMICAALLIGGGIVSWFTIPATLAEADTDSSAV